MLQICAAGPSLWYSYYVLSSIPLYSLSIPQCTPCGSVRRSHRGHPHHPPHYQNQPRFPLSASSSYPALASV